MRSDLIRLPRGARWLRRHVRVIAEPRRRTAVVTPRTTAPEIAIAVRRHPMPARATIEEAQP
jgi:hypothetical protein